MTTPSKTAATRLLENVHAELSACAERRGITLSEAIQQAVLDYLARQGATTAEAAGRAEEELPAGELRLIRKQLEELTVLVNALGALSHATRCSFQNFALLWLQVIAGKVEARGFDWQAFAEKHLTTKPKSTGETDAGDRAASS